MKIIVLVLGIITGLAILGYAAQDNNNTELSKAKEADKEKIEVSKEFYNLGSDAFKDKKYDKARSFLIKAISYNTEFIEAYALLGDIYAILKEETLAFENYKKCMDCVDKLKSPSEEIIKLRNDLFTKTAKFREWEAKLLTLDEEFVGRLLELGLKAKEENDYLLAEDIFSLVVKVDKNNSEASGYLQKVKDELSQGAGDASNVEAAQIYYQSGLAFFKQNKYEEAIEKFSKAVSAKKYFLEALFKLGECYEKTKNNIQAINNYRLCLRSLEFRKELTQDEKNILTAVKRNLGAIDNKSKEITTVREKYVTELIKTAKDCISQNSVDFAKSIYQKILKIEPGNKTAVEAITRIEKESTKKIGWLSLTLGGAHGVGVKTDGTLWSWGLNQSGQLGDGTNTSRNKPGQIGKDINWLSIVAGSSHTLALKSDGSLWAWGANEYGQLGDGTTKNRNSPIRIGTDTTWSVINCGLNHSIALKINGTLWTWGKNGYGALGDGTWEHKNVPIQIGIDTNWAIIAGGSELTAVLKTDGTLWTWGCSLFGQLGDGLPNHNRNRPMQIGTDTDWAAMVSNNASITALKKNGTIWTWGNNNFGQLGDGTWIDRNVPVQMGIDTDWAMIQAGGGNFMALKSDGSLWAWGANGSGQLGIGTKTNKNIPTQVGTDKNWQTIVFAGLSNSSAAFKNDGSVWIWGANGAGQLGDGTTTDKNSLTRMSH
ncbi:MAG: tetratricopeptide repeat protein [Planctomycetota bacterium]